MKYNTETDIQQQKILLVEDERINQIIATSLLQQLGHEVDLAVNGTQAIQKLQHNNYCLVLLDLGLPDVRGEQIAQFIRNDRSICHLPIIVNTAFDLSTVEKACYEIGVDMVINKPLKLELLKPLLQRLLEEPAKNGGKLAASSM